MAIGATITDEAAAVDAADAWGNRQQRVGWPLYAFLGVMYLLVGLVGLFRRHYGTRTARV